MSASGNLRQRFVRSAYYRLGVDVEFLVDIGDLAGGAKTVHADEPAFEADVALSQRVPASFTVQVVDSTGDTAQAACAIVVSAPLAFSGPPPAATLDDAYGFDLSTLVSGGRAPYAFDLTAGSLPTGMTLASAGQVSAAGVTGSTATVTIRVTDADARTASAPLTFAVGTNSASATTSRDLVRSGQPFSGTLSTNLSSPAWSFSSSPAGISITASADGSRPRYARRLCACSSPTATTASPSPTVRCRRGPPISEVLQPDPAPILSVSAVAVAASLTSPSTVRSGAAIAGTMSANFPNATWSFSQTPTSPAIALAPSGSTFSGIAPTVASPTSYALTATAAVGSFQASAPPIGLTVAPLLALSGGPSAYVDQDAGVAIAPTPPVSAGTTNLGALSYELMRSGTPVTLSASCPGLSFSASTGVISGTPSAVCSLAGLVIRGTDIDGATASTSPAFAIGISNALVALSGSLASTAIAGDAYSSGPLSISGGQTPYVWSIASGALPSGLALSPSTGTVTGVPTTAGTSNFSVQATDANGAISTSAAQTIAVSAALAVSASATSRTAYQKEAMPAIVATATGGNGTLTYAEVDASGTLSALGLSLSPTWSGAIMVTDAGNSTGVQTAAITIAVGAALHLGGTPTDPTVGTAYSYGITATGGSGSNSFSASNTTGTLAALGLAINSSTGVVSGSTPVAGTWTGNLIVTDAGNGTSSVAATIIVSNPLTLGGTPPNGVTGSAYSSAITALTSGGRSPYSYVQSSGSLPAGLSLASGGAVTGTPTDGQHLGRDHPGHRRRRPHRLRVPDVHDRHADVEHLRMGLQRRRRARQRQHSEPVDRGQRDRRLDLYASFGGLLPFLRSRQRRHDPVLGRKRLRPARQRHHHRQQHPRHGVGHFRGDLRIRRLRGHLRRRLRIGQIATASSATAPPPTAARRCRSPA